mmetsp:Transcript_31302/g.56735  ORF Transcript_31302/g.56735 Transcript_31302/m.56735 type:complete len:150 (+) Transcript_31302:111-560(+)|eukprot:CAMPEP_0202493748 /NCGR_PEP_ID=MMETSP1361-20130828/9967_1 /ASSEMBLY_ACC=CAM_ASM_000849 /TAXON_ID=210615 /ORGANISM="Staurosira complex sp., Strain CCMP2646" /LENGTH=149 /DNA_ID=CAMNT_0049124095 /DNA_START=73 /DNA_END=522 /DNA_ORIENTATION=-
MAILKILKKSVAFGSQPNASTFPELVDVLIWMRFVIAFIYGIQLSRKTELGAVGLLYGLNAVAFVPIMYTILLKANMDSYVGNIMFAGVPNALALLLLMWIYCYTLNNGSEEAALAKMIDVMQNLTTEAVEIETVRDGGQDTAAPGSEF